MPTTYAVPNGRTAFGAAIYTGNGASNSNTTQNISTPFYPDLTWVKARSDGSFYHRLTSTGITLPNYLSTNSTDAQGTLNDQISALASNYFQVKASGTGGTNQSGTTYVGWFWNAASGASVTNTTGSVSASVCANPTNGFSIAKFTSPTGTGNFTVGHGLGATPSMVFVKSVDSTGVWYVYHSSLPTDYYLRLNGTNAQNTDGVQWGTGMTSSVIGLRASYSTVSGAQTIAFAFAQVPGFSAFGSYLGNGSNDGPFVYLGFRPAFLLIKNASATSNAWLMYDNTRNQFNITDKKLGANVTVEENNTAELGGNGIGVDFLSNGFKSRDQTGSNQNINGNTYVYAAFAENPFKYANAR
jgi:hypothetical protein